MRGWSRLDVFPPLNPPSLRRFCVATPLSLFDARRVMYRPRHFVALYPLQNNASSHYENTGTCPTGNNPRKGAGKFEVQTVTCTLSSGDFTLSFRGFVTEVRNAVEGKEYPAGSALLMTQRFEARSVRNVLPLLECLVSYINCII